MASESTPETTTNVPLPTYLVERGNIQVASKHVSEHHLWNDVLKALAEKISTERTNIYRVYELYLHITQALPPNEHKHDHYCHGEHFISIAHRSPHIRKNEAAVLYCIFQYGGGETNTPVIENITFRTVSHLFTDTEINQAHMFHSKYLSNIPFFQSQDAGFSYVHFLQETNSDACLQYDIIKWLGDYSIDTLFQSLRYHVDHCREYANMIVPIYEKIIRNKKNNMTIQNRLYELFPERYHQATNPFLYTLSQLPIPQRNYMLGIPVHIDQPSEQEIKDRLEYIDTHDVDAYWDKYCIPLPAHHKSVTTVTEDDILMEKVTDYNLLDIVIYYDEHFCYYFTRPCFENTVETKKNPYTRKPLPIGVLMEMKHRMDLADSLQLGPSKTVKQMLQELKEKCDGSDIHGTTSTSSASARSVEDDGFDQVHYSFQAPIPFPISVEQGHGLMNALMHMAGTQLVTYLSNRRP